ncbi:MAG: hypothetical protein NTW92_00760 [Bacteroidetes bacterium]|nr:hypothetical protein [Bacteroidota bacterium]
MKKVILILNVLLIVSIAEAQTGIGTTTPINKFQVEATTADPATSGTSANGNFRLSGISASHVLDFGLSNTSNNSWIQARNKTYGTNYNLLLNPLGGNVGIGTTSPTAKLNIAGGGVRIHNGFSNATTRPALSTATLGAYEVRGVGSGGGVTQADGADDGFLRLSAGGGLSAGAQSSIDISGFSTLSEMNNNIVFRTAGVERMRLDLTGNLSGSTTNTLSGFGAQIYTISTSVSLAATDNAEVIQSNAASAIIITIPAGLPTGFNCMVLQYGAGQITFSGASGVTIINRNGFNKSIGQYALVTILHIGSNNVIISGELSN